MGVEKKLENMFDYQKFEGNGRLKSMIEDTERRTADINDFALDDSALENVAGGVPMHSEKVIAKFEPATALKDVDDIKKGISAAPGVLNDQKKYFKTDADGIGGGKRANI